MEIDNHVFDRMSVRLTDAEREKVIGAIAAKWGRLQNNKMKDFAIIAMALDSLRMTDNSGWGSNGEAVVGIVRRGTLQTVMLRRFNQPMTKEALRVNRVKWAIKPPIAAQGIGRKKKHWR